MIVTLFGMLAMSVVVPIVHRLIGRGIFVLGALTSALAAGYLLVKAPVIWAGHIVVQHAHWLPQLGLDLDFRLDALSWVLALIVTVVGSLVLLYCVRYFGPDDPALGRFGGVLLAFAGVMFGLVTADSAYLLFIFWEATSVLSYLLIGHFTGRRAARAAAMQALLVTTLGGLVMLVGLVAIHVATGSPLLSQMVERVGADASLAHSPLVIVGGLLVIVGIATKSALVPFHFWLPGAMAAPTPVSAYLHAASMVKAGIYLALRMIPGFVEVPGFRETLIVMGVWTMCVGGWRSLRQTDLKLVLAYGTVSQLGFLAAAAGFGGRTAALAALAMVIAHALFKAALFLTVGIIDHRAGTRDLRKLSGLGKSAPVLATVAIISAASMAGVIPLWGFVAKEGIFSAFIEAAEHGDAWGWFAIIGTAIGTVLTVAYTCRFVWGAFATKPGVEPVATGDDHPDILIAPIALTLGTLTLPWLASGVDHLLALFADTTADDGSHYHLAIWHGLEPAFFLSLATLAVGIGLFAIRPVVARIQALVPPIIESARGYWFGLRVVDTVAARVTSFTQRGSLPFYLATILLVLVGSIALSVAFGGVEPVTNVTLSWTWPQLGIVGIFALAAISATQSRKRFQGVVLVGITGYGMTMLFALSGAPDLGTTQALIETVSIIVFVLVLRRLPADHSTRRKNMPAALRWAIGLVFGLTVAAVAGYTLSQRVSPSDGLEFFHLAKEGGHGINVVNVTLVDIRGWDTMGELSVLIAAATGIASLIYLRTRTSKAGRAESLAPSRRERRLGSSSVIDGSLAVEVARGEERRTFAVDYGPRRNKKVWLLAGYRLAPSQRSIVVEVVTRLVFHALFILSIYLLFAGHNAPGGGFAGGIIAGLAIALRYLAGGREELDEAVRMDAGKLLGVGMLLAAGTAVVPMFFAQAPLTSSWIDTTVPWIGEIVLVSSTVFDIGVYLIVIGLVIDILRSLGSELDLQAERDDADHHPDQLLLDGADATGVTA